MTPAPLIALLALTGTAALAVGVVSTYEQMDEARVTRVVDGDTFIADVGGAERTIRLLNVDTPETKDPAKAVECMGPEATAFLEKALPAGSVVTLQYDEERTDKYGRTLAGVLSNGSLVNSEIARQGFGTALQIGPNKRWLRDVQSAQDVARSEGKGLYNPAISCTPPAQVNAAVSSASAAASRPTGSTSSEAAGTLATIAPALEGMNALDTAITTARKSAGSAWALLSDLDVSSMRQRLQVARATLSERKASVEQEVVALQEKESAATTEAARQAQQKAASDAAAANRQAEASRPKADTQPAPKSSAPPAAKAPAPKPSATRPPKDSSSGSGSSANPYPGYNGPRCYAPGGQTWRPC